jgi:hypothetical protein
VLEPQADDLFMNEGARIITLAAAHRLPAIYRLGYQAGEGGLLAYGRRCRPPRPGDPGKVAISCST